MTAGPEPGTRLDWEAVADELRALFGAGAHELRFSLHGRSAVRVLASGRPVAPRHAEPPDPSAPWSHSARCGAATGWLLAEGEPGDAGRARELLQRTVERHSALVLQALIAQRSLMVTDLLEGLTHRLRTDVSTLQAVAEGALSGMFEADELEQIPGEVRRVGETAQTRLSNVREVMTALHPAARCLPEPLLQTLRAELDGAGVDVPVADVEGERPMTFVPGPGWAACARLLAEAVARDERLGGREGSVTVRAHPDGWEVTAGCTDPGQPVAWTEQAVGGLVHAGQIVAAAGGFASAARLDGGRLRVRLTVPAAPSG
jgi:hypothetical protein